jgi:acetyl-CoA acetyltransferase
MPLARRIAIVGVGETRYERAGTRGRDALVLEAARAALADAGLRGRDVDGIIDPDATYPSLHELARNLGIAGPLYAASSYNGGTAVVAAPLQAALAIEAGLARTVLCCQGLTWGSERRGNVGAPHAAMPMKATFELPFGWYPQIVHFAGMARRHMALYGTTAAQLGAVAVACRRHAARTENALLRDKPLTLEEYLAAPYLAEPFRTADCCLVNDGAGAFVMSALARARDLPRPPVAVLGVAVGVIPDGEYSSLRADYLPTAAVHSAPRAFAMAGVGPADVDVVQLYDNFTAHVIRRHEAVRGAHAVGRPRTRRHAPGSSARCVILLFALCSWRRAGRRRPPLGRGSQTGCRRRGSPRRPAPSPGPRPARCTAAARRRPRRRRRRGGRRPPRSAR